LKEILDEVKGRRFQAALDVGCGRGKLVLELRENCELVVGLDRKVEGLPGGEKGAFFVGGRAEEIPFKGEVFDLLLSSFSIHEFDDHGRALREMARVMRPGGLLLCIDWMKGASVAPGQRPLSPDEMRELLESAGFEEVSVKPLEGKRMFVRALKGKPDGARAHTISVIEKEG